MKRFRHYKKGTAIVLCCFGSVNQQAKYDALRQQYAAHFVDADIYIAVSSRSVLNKLANQELNTLPEQLAALDRAGYQRICVVSCYLFPTDEHQQLLKTVAGFKAFSLAKIEHTSAILGQVKHANSLVSALDNRFACSQGEYNLYIYHGAPNLDAPGYNSIWYLQCVLGQLSSRNLFCSLEGASPFSMLAASLKDKLAKSDKLRLIPLLLVSGNHFENDLNHIKKELCQSAEVEIASPIIGDRFCLLDLPQVQTTLIEQTSECLVKLGVPSL